MAGWISLFTLHAIWPFLWIWATLYREDRGWGFKQAVEKTEHDLGSIHGDLAALNRRLAQLENSLTVSAPARTVAPDAAPSSDNPFGSTAASAPAGAAPNRTDDQR